jgi:hypothetical protein
VVDTEGGVTGVDRLLGVVTTGEPCCAGPPIGYCFAGPPTAVCFFAPPIALWAKARLDKALPDKPNNTANMTAPLFMALPFTAVLAKFYARFRLTRKPNNGTFAVN